MERVSSRFGDTCCHKGVQQRVKEEDTLYNSFGSHTHTHTYADSHLYRHRPHMHTFPHVHVCVCVCTSVHTHIHRGLAHKWRKDLFKLTVPKMSVHNDEEHMMQ